MQAHYESTWRRIKDQERVLVAQDTTSLDYSAHTKGRGLGPLEHEGSQGLLVHTALALSEAGEPVGLVHQQTWVREAQQTGKSGRRRGSSTTKPSGFAGNWRRRSRGHIYLTLR